MTGIRRSRAGGEQPAGFDPGPGRGYMAGMKTVGKRREPAVSATASAELLKAGARLNEAAHGLPGAGSTFIPKGVYRFATLDEADRHRNACLAQGMARLARERS